MKSIIRYFTNRTEFAEAVAREVERVLSLREVKATRFSQHVKKIIRCSLDQDYEVLSLDSPAKVSGVFDLSEMRGGDRIEIEVLVPVANCNEKLLERWILDNFQEMPVFALPILVLPSRSKVVVRQTRGSSVIIGVEIFAF